MTGWVVTELESRTGTKIVRNPGDGHVKSVVING